MTLVSANAFRSVAAGDMGVHGAFLSLVTLTFDLCLSERGTKHVFRVNLAQICSAVPEISDAQTKVTDGAKTEPYLCAVKNKLELFY